MSRPPPAGVSPDYESFSAGKRPTGPTAQIAVLLLEPALRILLVVESDSLLRKLECVLSVEHYCELFGARRVLTRDDRAWMWTVWNPPRM
jgi:hypothetical protein